MPESKAVNRRRIPGWSAIFENAPRFALLGILVLVVSFFSVLLPETYFTSDNLLSIGELQAVALLLALAVLMPLITGEFDLSVASTFGVAQLVVAGLLSRNDLPVAAALLAVLAMGGLIGAVNAVLIVRLEISSFIVTLGMSTILSGLALAYAGGEVISTGIPESFLRLAQSDLFGLPLPIVYASAVAILLWLFLIFTSTGRRLAAAGGNRKAARLSGVRTGRCITIAFIGCGMIAACAGIISASNLGSGQPLLGPDFLLPAYAGAFLGATTITPGRFNVWGTVIAVYVLATSVTGLQQVGVPAWVESVFNGAALIIAVAFSGYIARLRARRLERREGRARIQLQETDEVDRSSERPTRRDGAEAALKPDPAP